MTGAALNTLINKKCRTTDTTYPLATKLIDVNIFKDEIAGKIQERRPEIWNTPTLDDLVANQREYAFPADVLNRLISLELKFTANDGYVLAKPYNRLQYRDGLLTETHITAVFDNANPRYFIRRNAIYILSGTVPVMADGINLIYDAFPSDLANLTGSTDLSIDPSTTTHGFPRQFHELLARRVSIAYKSVNKIALDPEDLLYAADLEKTLDNFAIAILDESIVGALPATDNDNGFSL